MRRLIFALVLLSSCLIVRADEVVWPPSPLPAGTPVAQFPAPRLDQLNQFLAHIYIARTQPVDLIFDGDSITDLWQGKGQDLFKKLYVPRHVVDYAIAGDRTEHVLWRLQYGQLDGLHPKLVMLMIGTNNMGESTPQEIADGVTKIVQAYRTQTPDAHILLLGIFPRSALPTDPVRAKIKAVNAIISKLDDGQNITYLDIGDKFLQPDGSLSKDIMPDLLHPSPAGYQIWADAVQPVIDKYCPMPADAAAATATPPPALTPDQIAKINATLPTLSWPFAMHAPAGTPASTFPIPHADWFGRVQGDLDKLKGGPYDLVFDGDSITDNWQNRGANVLKARYGAIKTLDVAIGGDQTQHVLWRMQRGDLDGQDPKLIMLMIGTNNGGQSSKDIAGAIKMIIGEYKTRCPHAHILLLGIFPRDPLPTSGARAHIKETNAILSTFADDRVTYMDIGDKFLAPDGTLTDEIMPDHLHPSEKGYQIWADAIQPVIDKYFPNPTAPKAP